jgi:MFS family permease
VIGLSAVLGPIAGGALIAANAFGSGWRLIFFVNLPLGLIAAIGAARLMPESRSPKPPSLDIVGTLFAALGMGLLIYPLIQGREADWPAWTYLMIAASAASFALLAVWLRRERQRGHDPLIEASIFKHRAYTAGLATIVVFFAGMIGTLLVLTLFLQLGQHFSAIHAGVTLAPFAVGSAIGATLAGALLVPRFGRLVLQFACLILAAGVLWLRHTILAHGLHADSLLLVAPQLVVGIGMGMMISPLFDFTLASVTDTEVGSASGCSTRSSSSEAQSVSQASAPCSSRCSSTPATSRRSATLFWWSWRRRRCFCCWSACFRHEPAKPSSPRTTALLPRTPRRWSSMWHKHRPRAMHPPSSANY